MRDLRCEDSTVSSVFTLLSVFDPGSLLLYVSSVSCFGSWTRYHVTSRFVGLPSLSVLVILPRYLASVSCLGILTRYLDTVS